MDPIIIYLDSEGSSPRRLRMLSIIYGILGISFLAQAMLAQNAFRYVMLVLALTWILIALNYPRLFKAKAMTFDDSGITWSRTKPRSLRVTWDQIAYMEASTLEFRIRTKDLKVLTINLGNLTYEQHKTVKPQIIDLARSNGVDVRMI